jgi:hypothetical protein
MSNLKRLVSYGLLTGAVASAAIAAGLTPWSRSASPLLSPPTPAHAVASVPSVTTGPGGGEQVDVVFAIDTTGSMDKLIDSAKRSVWGIARHIRASHPNASVRIGLVAYRDIGDAYVTADTPLTDDLDGAFTALSKLEATGGGDIPEDVDAALDDAVHKMAWRDGASRMIFVVGDAPPATRGEVPSYDRLADEAGRAGIVVNALRCGADPDTARTFARIAELGHGAFSTIPQDGGVQQIATPYDDRLGALAARVDGLAVIYGDGAERARDEGQMAAVAAAPAAARADRAAYYAAGGTGRKGDLVDRYAALDISELAKDQLPKALQGYGKEELKRELAKRAADRAAAEAEIKDLTVKREAYLKAQASGDHPSAFDEEVNVAVDRALAR